MSSDNWNSKALDPLLSSEDNWIARMGLSFPGSHVIFRGKDLHKDLGDLDWMELYLYGITGKRYQPEQLRIFNAIFTFTSYPDPRIWNNRVAALGGTAKSTVGLSTAAAIAVSEAKQYGGLPAVKTIELLIKVNKLKKQKPLPDVVSDMLDRKVAFFGYGRPIIRHDERVQWFHKLVSEYGFDKGEHYQLAFDIEKELQRHRRGVQMNIAILYAGVAADFGMSPIEYQAYGSLCFVAGMVPCYMDARSRKSGTFLPMRCERINYRGPARREW